LTAPNSSFPQVQRPSLLHRTCYSFPDKARFRDIWSLLKPNRTTEGGSLRIRFPCPLLCCLMFPRSPIKVVPLETTYPHSSPLVLPLFPTPFQVTFSPSPPLHLTSIWCMKRRCGRLQHSLASLFRSTFFFPSFRPNPLTLAPSASRFVLQPSPAPFLRISTDVKSRYFSF